MVKKFLIALILSYCVFPDLAFCTDKISTGNKDYHLIYIDISRCQDRQNFTYDLRQLLDSILLRKDDFLIFLSNGYQPEILSSDKYDKQQKDNLISLLQTLNTSPPVLRFDKDTIFKIWDIHDIKNVTIDNQTILLYKNICFHYFISADFLKLEETEIVDWFLLIKDLTKKHIDTRRIIIDFHFSAKESEVFLARKSQLDENNQSGYKYIFNSY